jgi:hypothetical protein
MTDIANGSTGQMDVLLDLRSQGRSFGTIAASTGFPDATSARSAYLRGLGSLAESERSRLRDLELGYVDILERSIRSKPGLDEHERAQLLQATERMRD